ncbi:MAG: thioredoxin family protein [Planctomycetota bacterium]
MGRGRFSPVTFLLMVALGFIVFRLFAGGAAETPDYFGQYSTLSAGFEEAQRSQRPVLALATADWCGPCQSFKRGALSSPEVADFVGSNTIPVYIDVTDGNSPDAQSLGVQSIPAVYVITPEGQVIAETGGAMSEGAFLAWAQAAVDSAN